MTVTAWERFDDTRHMMRNERHRAAMHRIYHQGIAAGTMSSTWLA